MTYQGENQPAQPPALYGQNQQYPPQYQTVYAVRPPMMPHAVWSFVLAAIAFVTPLLFFIALPLAGTAVTLGHVGLSKIAKSPTPRGGRGFAIAGLILGYVALAASLVVLMLAVVIRQLGEESTFE